LRATQQGPQSRQQFRQFKGFDHVVVGAQIQTLHPVLQRIARRKDQHWHGRVGHFGAAQQTGEFQSVDARQTDVDDPDIKGLLGQHFLSAFATAHPIDGVARIGQTQLDAAGDHDVIFNKQQAHGEPFQLQLLLIMVPKA